MEVAARLVGMQTLPALLQDPVLAAMPGPVFGFLIDTLQHWGKVLEEAGLLVAMVGALAVLGGAAARLARWRAGARAGLLAGAAAWLIVLAGGVAGGGGGGFCPPAGGPPPGLVGPRFAVLAVRVGG